MTETKAAELPGREWAELLSKDHGLSKERVILTGTFGPSLNINKSEWERHFPGFQGFTFGQGKAVEIRPEKSGERKVRIPDWVWARLGAARGRRYGITERDGRYYLKKLRLAEHDTPVPGITVIDSFKGDTVHRTYAGNLDLRRITRKDLTRLLGHMGRFKYDPVSPFETMDGRAGYLGRKTLLGRPGKEDQTFLQSYEQRISESQLENGSWENNTMITASNLIKLRDTGVSPQAPAVARGVTWLLSTPEPLGFPGLFMLTDRLTSRFSEWKAKQRRGRSGRPHRRTTDREARAYLENRDVLNSISAWPCELRLTWTSGMTLEALLRCGLHEEPRVIKAVNTLLAMSERGGWCGCGYFDSRDRNFVPESLDPVDFNRMPFPRFSLGENFAARLTCDNVRFLALKAGRDRAFLTNRFLSTGECSMVVLKALSFHPRFPG